MRLLLDTSVLIDVLRGRGDGFVMMKKATLCRSEMTTPVISVAEIHAAVRAGEQVRARRLLETLERLPVSERIAERAGALTRVWARKGRTLALPDMLVAATAIEHDLTLATSNVKDYPMPEVELYRLS